jgi:hypothetical protein
MLQLPMLTFQEEEHLEKQKDDKAAAAATAWIEGCMVAAHQSIMCANTV